MDNVLYFSGGIEKTQYGQLPKEIMSRHGFEGCLASLDLSGESTDLISDAVVPSALVITGCDVFTNVHPGKKCTHDLCANHGTCVQQWNSYTCDCDMTSFTGPTCNDGNEKKEMRIICCVFFFFFYTYYSLYSSTPIEIPRFFFLFKRQTSRLKFYVVRIFRLVYTSLIFTQICELLTARLSAKKIFVVC